MSKDINFDIGLSVYKGDWEGAPCPICKTTLEWSTRECDNCGYDKP